MKSNYLANLEAELSFLNKETRQQIIDEYEVHISERIKEGALESDVIQSLESPKEVAYKYAEELDIKYYKLKVFMYRLLKKLEKIFKVEVNKIETTDNILSLKNNIKLIFSLMFKVFIKLFSFGLIIFSIIALLSTILAAIIIPKVITFTNFKFSFYFLIYGELLFQSIFLITITYTLYSFIKKGKNE